MAEIKWIKITVGMFDNRKIRYLRTLPEGDSIVLIWIMLLTMAGRCNAGGMIFLTENIPYTPKILANELGFEENTVILALGSLEQLGMIVRDDEFFSIAGWSEHQSVDRMEEIREQTRQRVARHREKQALTECNVTGNVTVTECNATDIDKDIDKEKDIYRESTGDAPTKAARTRAFRIPTLEEVQAYCAERGNTVNARRFIDYYTSNGWRVGKVPMKDWKAAVRNWERGGTSSPGNGGTDSGSFDTGDALADALRRTYGGDA